MNKVAREIEEIFEALLDWADAHGCSVEDVISEYRRLYFARHPEQAE